MNRNHVIFILILTIVGLIFYPVYIKNSELPESLGSENVSEDIENKRPTQFLFWFLR